MKLPVLFLFLSSMLSAHAGEPKSVLFIAGKPSHGPGEHEFHDGCNLLAKALDQSGHA